MVSIVSKELHFDEELKKKIKNRDNKIEDLQYELDNTNDTIDELADKVLELQNIVDYFKELWRKFIIEFWKDKFFSNDKVMILLMSYMKKIYLMTII